MESQIQKLKLQALDHIRCYMNACLEDGADPGYTEDDIKKCAMILNDFIESLVGIAGGNEPAVMASVEKTVVALNDWNKRTDGSLIDTDGREDLARLINKAAESVGVGNGQDDITAEWRDW